MKREGELKAAFTEELKRQCPSFIVLRYMTAGGPDRSVIGVGRQTNWEMKHGTPDFVSHDNQALICTRLAVQAHCRYVLWQERKGAQRTLIVHPRVILERSGWNVEPEAFCVGFNIPWLVNYVRHIHEHHRQQYDLRA